MSTTAPDVGTMAENLANGVGVQTINAVMDVLPFLVPFLAAMWAVGFVWRKVSPPSSEFGGAGPSHGVRSSSSADGGLNLSPATYRQYAREARQEGDHEQAKHWSRKAQAAARVQAGGRRAGHSDNARYGKYGRMNG